MCTGAGLRVMADDIPALLALSLGSESPSGFGLVACGHLETGDEQDSLVSGPRQVLRYVRPPLCHMQTEKTKGNER